MKELHYLAVTNIKKKAVLYIYIRGIWSTEKNLQKPRAHPGLFGEIDGWFINKLHGLINIIHHVVFQLLVSGEYLISSPGYLALCNSATQIATLQHL